MESEWDEREQALMLALGRYQSMCCPRCAGYLPDTTDPAAEGRYHTPPPTRCHQCTSIGQAAESVKTNPHPQALLYHPTRR